MVEVKEQQTETSEKGQGKTNIEKANDTVTALKAENDRTEKLLERQEALKVEETLSGRSVAGVSSDKPEEESAKEYANRVMAGGDL